MSFLDAVRRKLHLRSLERGDYQQEGGRPVENLDAASAAYDRATAVDLGGAAPGYPPGYVNDYDGRPRR